MSCLAFLDKKSLKYNDLNKNLISHIEENRLSIILNSEESDICRSYALYLVYWIHKEENKNKTVYIMSNNYEKALILKNDLKNISKRIFLKIDNETEKLLQYSNGVKVKFFKLHKHLQILDVAHFTISLDAAYVKNHIFLKFYKAALPSLSAVRDSRMVVSSSPNGYNLFYKLFTDAENGKNLLSPLRLYYWEDGKKNGKWVKEKIDLIGEEEFHIKYNLTFKHVKGDRKKFITD